ncbi:hypothetical protein NDU88_003561 [Pleurodeles waltl]|uniref:Uncharacterized protein n=1 Tax=Pleurodeles waltl TaxID=8319 RepID=A0AAV7RG90_PLEWA|nr:hypothetical protein NDU88_003561 [Pleurodeles waltl]
MKLGVLSSEGPSHCKVEEKYPTKVPVPGTAPRLFLTKLHCVLVAAPWTAACTRWASRATCPQVRAEEGCCWWAPSQLLFSGFAVHPTQVGSASEHSCRENVHDNKVVGSRLPWKRSEFPMPRKDNGALGSRSPAAPWERVISPDANESNLPVRPADRSGRGV